MKPGNFVYYVLYTIFYSGVGSFVDGNAHQLSQALHNSQNMCKTLYRKDRTINISLAASPGIAMSDNLYI